MGKTKLKEDFIKKYDEDCNREYFLKVDVLSKRII